MKKMVLLVLLFFLALTLLCGQESKSKNFGLACLIAVSDNHIAPGPGLAIGRYNTEFFGQFGLGWYVNFVVPIVIFETEDGMETATGLAASLLLGPSYMIYDNGVFAIPVTAGVHFNCVVPIQFTTVKINLGVGANFDFVWRFGQKWYGYARILAAYNFGAGGEFLSFPGLGFGYSF